MGERGSAGGREAPPALLLPPPLDIPILIYSGKSYLTSMIEICGKDGGFDRFSTVTNLGSCFLPK